MSRQSPDIPLPPRLLEALQGLARAYRQQGADLFVFGSFARGDARRTSDLDLGVEWRGEPSKRTFSRLYDDVQALPTIRKIDLVDFSQASPGFRCLAERDKLPLA
ncbi:MAG: nucleotidyltransferase domain-containing protein [Deinococcota bacterium]|nr:nucleotidyltransferase domain-containing protein [Deinococcota bacterium]